MKKMFTTALATIALAAATTFAQTEILGAGATFPYPLYSKMFSSYNQLTKVKVNYQSIGSGGGVQQITAKTVDFGGTDAFLSEKEETAMGAKSVHIPTCIGSVVLAYNLPGNPVIKLTPALIADMYLGKITKWNDSKIVAVNKGVKLPPINIIVVRRSDGSGTTSIFTDYLAKVSPEWKTKVGAGKSVDWPAGIGAKGNEGVAGNIKNMPGAIGYTEFAYAKRNNMPAALVQNKSGKFIAPNMKSTSLAAKALPANTKINLTNTDAPDGYPISGLTWVVIYQDQNYGGRNQAKAAEVVKLIKWMITDGQKYAAPLDYSPLPKAAQTIALKNLSTVTFGGKPLMK